MIGPVRDEHLPALHALNEAHASELSSVTLPELRRMLGEAFVARAVGGDALLIAFDQGAAYDSPNFVWFRDRYPRFVYVDRVVVGAARRGEGLARQLYEALFAEARRAGHDRVVAEINVDPPNPGSDAFHAALGFVEVGRATLAGRGKAVRYVSRTL